MKNLSRAGVPFVLLAICLFVMYGTNVGIPGIAQYWKAFRLLDMQWFYSADTVAAMLQKLGADGIRHYLYYFIVDVVFILLLFVVQVQLSKAVSAKDRKIRKLLLIGAAARGVFDLLEDLLLSRIITEKLSMEMVPVASCVTGIKFLCLAFWGSLFLICAVRYAKTKGR